MSKVTLISVLIMVFAGSGCSKIIPKLDEVIPDSRKDYEKAQTLPDLEVPPDLSTEAIRDRMAIPEGGEAASFSSYQERRADQQRADDLESSATSAIRVLENEHVLAVEGAPVQVWPRLETFFREQGYTLDLNDVELGIIETAWVEEESQLARDKFKVFAENGEEAGTTVLYVSHEAEELVPQGEDLVWQRRPRNVEAERQIVDALQASVSGNPTAVAEAPAEDSEPAVVSRAPALAAGGSTATTATTAPAVGTTAPESGEPRHAELVSVGGGKFYLTVAEDFPRAWKTTGRALENAGMDVKDSDKGRGLYIIEVAAGGDAEQDESGVWNKLKFWDRGESAEYQVSLTGVGEKTEVVVLDKNGRWETGDQAGMILNKLHDALNSGRI